MAHPSPSPKIGVIPDRTQKSATNLDDPVPSMQIIEADELLSEVFDSDAHFTCYHPVGMELSAGWPRLSKPILGKIREAGGDVRMVMMALDYDRPGHSEWTSPDEVEEFLDTFDAVASEVGDFALEWSYIYTTKNGARVVYMLEKGISPEDYESKHKWLCQQFNSKGLEIDLAVSDWTRIFRAPMVIRGGEPSWEHQCFRIETQDDALLDASFLGDSGRGLAKSRYATIHPVDADKPDPDSLGRYLYSGDPNPGNGFQTMSDWHKQVKKRLRGRECFAPLFEGAVLAAPGARDDTLHAMVGQVCALVASIEGTTPEHIYALFYEPTLRLEPDQDTPDWTDKLWDKVQRIWALEDAKERQRRHEEEQREEERASITDQVIEGMRSWCDNQYLHSTDPDIRADAARQMFFANAQSTFYPINQKGRYEGMPLKEQQIIPYIRSRGLEGLIPTRIVTQQGTRDVSVKTIINDYSWPVSEVIGYPQLTEGGYIDQENKLRLSLYERNDALLPTFNRDVDGWLQALFGDKYELACKWIAYALAFEEGCICALSIHGQPGVGKKLLVRGLAECLKNPAHADASDIVGDWQYGLRESPFVWVDEGWPNGKHHPLDTLRNLTGGDPLRLNMKMLAPVKAFNPARVVMTANNMDLVTKLLSGRDVTQEDTDALRDRLLHFDVGGEAAEYLAIRGGVRHTSGWIQADGGGASKFTLARHFLWLHANRHQLGQPDKDGRFLVKGEGNESVMAEIRTSAGEAQIVVEALIGLINTEMPKGEKSRAGIAVQDNKLFVTTKAVVEFYRNAIKKTAGGRLDAKSISAVLKNISESQKTVAGIFKQHLGMVDWHQIDPEMLYIAGKRDGWSCPYLHRLVDARKQAKREAQK